MKKFLYGFLLLSLVAPYVCAGKKRHKKPSKKIYKSARKQRKNSNPEDNKQKRLEKKVAKLTKQNKTKKSSIEFKEKENKMLRTMIAILESQQLNK